MRLALTATNNGLDSNLSPVFGRCPYFVVVDWEDGNVNSDQSVQNPAMNQGGGAGVLAAQTVGDQNVDVVITGNVGPRAFDVLNRLGIEIYAGRQTSLKDNLEAFEKSQLDKISAPDSMGAGPGGKGGAGAGRGRGRGAGRR